jgi:hypothetical protein
VKKFIIALLLLSSNLNAQNEEISFEVSQKKIELDTKVKMSRSYLGVSAVVLIGGVLLKEIDNDIKILGAGGSLAAILTTTYYLGKHLIIVSKRNKFYKKHNLKLKKKRRKNKVVLIEYKK